MSSPTLNEISIAKSILSTATTVMCMENAAQLAGLENNLSVIDEFVGRHAQTLLPHKRDALERLGKKIKQRMTAISGIRLTDDELFRALFGIGLPPGARIGKKPYVIQCSLPDGEYERTCLAAGMKPCYTESGGICPAPNHIRTEMRPNFGDAVTMVRAEKKPVINQEEWPAVKIPIMGTAGNFYARTPSGLKKLPVTYEERPNPLTERHEEIHGYQAILTGSGFLQDLRPLERDLFDEESAECIPEAEMGIRKKRPRLVHTAYFGEHDLEEGRRNLLALAKRVVPNKPDDAKKLVKQRDRNEYALFRVYGSADPGLKRLVGWALHFMDFYDAHRIIPAIQAVYETT